MGKLSPAGVKWLKILHILLIVLFLGGILSSFMLNLQLDFTNFAQVYNTYQNWTLISDDIVRIGAVGTLLLGVIYGVFTKWGFFKYRWITVKWVLFLLQTFLGILLVDRLLTTNMAILQVEQAAALTNPVFLGNHTLRQTVVIAQIAFSIFMIVISTLKPWEKKKSV